MRFAKHHVIKPHTTPTHTHTHTLCIYVCVYIYTYIYIHTYTHIYTHTYINIYIYTHIFFMYMFMYMYSFIFTLFQVSIRKYRKTLVIFKCLHQKQYGEHRSQKNSKNKLPLSHGSTDTNDMTY